MPSDPGADGVKAAIAAADAAEALAKASAATGVANATLAYTLSTQILQDDQFAAIIPLDILVAQVIAAGLQAYVQVGKDASAATLQVQSAVNAANQTASSTFQKYNDQFKSILDGKGNG